MKRRKVLGLLSAAPAAISIPVERTALAQTGNWDTVVDAAKKEGNIYVRLVELLSRNPAFL